MNENVSSRQPSFHAAAGRMERGAGRHVRLARPAQSIAQRLDPLAPDMEVLGALIAAHQSLWLDLGTGDGRFVRRLAEEQPETLAIGLDACYANLRAELRRAPANAVFVVADALALSPEVGDLLAGKAQRVTVNFPWGSLLRGLLPDDGRLLARLVALTAPGALVEARLNGGALGEIGWELEEGVRAIQRGLRESGFAMRKPTPLGANDLRACPTTWARRLAFGRDPRAYYLCGARIG